MPMNFPDNWRIRNDWNIEPSSTSSLSTEFKKGDDVRVIRLSKSDVYRFSEPNREVLGKILKSTIGKQGIVRRIDEQIYDDELVTVIKVEFPSLPRIVGPWLDANEWFFLAKDLKKIECCHYDKSYDKNSTLIEVKDGIRHETVCSVCGELMEWWEE
jgi:hypothetical protein